MGNKEPCRLCGNRLVSALCSFEDRHLPPAKCDEDKAQAFTRVELLVVLGTLALLASDAGSFITGQTFLVDGGQSIG